MTNVRRWSTGQQAEVPVPQSMPNCTTGCRLADFMGEVGRDPGLRTGSLYFLHP